MSVTIRPYRRGGWEVDIRVVTPDGTREFRVRKRAPVSSRSAAARWAEGREHVLFERVRIDCGSLPSGIRIRPRRAMTRRPSGPLPSAGTNQLMKPPQDNAPPKEDPTL